MQTFARLNHIIGQTSRVEEAKCHIRIDKKSIICLNICKRLRDTRPRRGVKDTGLARLDVSRRWLGKWRAEQLSPLSSGEYGT